MGIFKGIRNALSIEGDSPWPIRRAGWRACSASGTASGVVINEDNCLAVADFYKCDRVRRETISALPLKLYATQTRGRQEARDHSAVLPAAR
jgi:phage portal protein BeeE